MYDTIEVPLLPGVIFRNSVRSIVRSIADHLRSPFNPRPEVPFKTNKYYAAVVDLRDSCGIDAILHTQSRTGTHKIQLIEAGRKYRGEITDTIAAIVHEHPERLEVSRVDACANIADGPTVLNFAESVRARYAQFQSNLGILELQEVNGTRIPFTEMGRRALQMMYLGKRPNCHRVYDKLAELDYRWCLQKRRHDRAQKCLPTDSRTSFVDFAIWCSGQFVGPMQTFIEGSRQLPLPGEAPPAEQLQMLPKLPRVLTRVERQMGAGRVPAEVSTFKKLFHNALDFNPFTRLEFPPVESPPDTTRLGVTERAALETWQRYLDAGMTYQQLYRMWDEKRNGRRIEQKFASCLVVNREKHISISSAELYERYRDTVSRQLAA